MDLIQCYLKSKAEICPYILLYFRQVTESLEGTQLKEEKTNVRLE